MVDPALSVPQVGVVNCRKYKHKPGIECSGLAQGVRETYSMISVVFGLIPGVTTNNLDLR